MSDRSYDGEPINAAWQSDLEDAQGDSSGKTVDATPKVQDGGEQTDFWPSELPREPFERGTSRGQSVQSQVVEALVQFPDASDSQIAEYVDCSVSQVRAVRHKVSVFVPPPTVQFSIPAEPSVEANRLAVYALDHEQSRFDRSELESEGDTESNDGGAQDSDRADEIARRYYDEEEAAKEIAEDLDMSAAAVKGTLAQAERNQTDSGRDHDSDDRADDVDDSPDEGATDTDVSRECHRPGERRQVRPVPDSPPLGASRGGRGASLEQSVLAAVATVVVLSVLKRAVAWVREVTR